MPRARTLVVWWLTVGVGVLLLNGCGSSSGNGRSASAHSAGATEAAAPWPAEKLARAHAHYATAVIHEMNGEEEEALEEYHQSALNDPDNETLILEVSRRFIQKKEFDKARELLLGAIKRPNASGALYARLGLVYGQLGKAEEAIAADRIAIKRSPDNLAGYQNLFTTLMQEKKQQDALKVLDDAAGQRNVSVEYLIGLAELYNAYVMQFPTQKPKVQARAVAVLNRAEKLSPEHPLLQLRLADSYGLHGESAKAAEIYLDLLKRLPDLPPIREQLHAKLATIYLRDSDRTNAIEQLQGLLRNNPTNPQAHYYLGYLFYTDRKPAQAEEHFSKAIVLSPDFAEAYYDLALAQLAQDKPAEALATLDKARKKFPENFALEFYSAMAQMEQKNYAEALRHFTSCEVMAKATNPKLLDRDFYFQVGACSERTGDYKRAEENFETCLKMAPDWPEALNYLGYMWAERGEKLDRAREMIEKAVKAEPKNGAFLDSLAWVLFKQNQPQEALPYALQAVENTPKADPTVFDHLGDIYAALNQPEKARASWQKALELEPNEAIKKKLDGQKP